MKNFSVAIRIFAVVAFWAITTMLILSISGHNYTVAYREHGGEPGFDFFYRGQLALLISVGFSIVFPIFSFRTLAWGFSKAILLVMSAFALLFSDAFFVCWFVGATAETSTGERIDQPMALFCMLLAMISALVAAISYRSLRAKEEPVEVLNASKSFWAKNSLLITIGCGILLAILAIMLYNKYVLSHYDF